MSIYQLILVYGTMINDGGNSPRCACLWMMSHCELPIDGGGNARRLDSLADVAKAVKPPDELGD